MKKSLLVVQLLCLLITNLVRTGVFAADSQKISFLPASGFSPGWALEGPIKKFTGEDLFEYINGEAELYLQFGFKVLTSGLYLKDKNENLGMTADVYEMGSELEAFGIYANYRKPEAEPIKTGSEGFVGPSQLMYYQGRYFVQLNASGAAAEDQAVSRTLAGLISRNLPASPHGPPEIALLKIARPDPQNRKIYPPECPGLSFFQKWVNRPGPPGRPPGPDLYSPGRFDRGSPSNGAGL